MRNQTQVAVRDKMYIRDKVYIPVKALVSKESTKDAYTKHFFDDKACSRCEYAVDRFCHVCETCPSYKGTTLLYSYKTISDVPYMGLPVGDKKNIERNTGVLFDDFKIIDRRTKTPFDYKIKFTATLRPHQEKVVAQFLKKKYGLLEAPPRTGKTLLLLYLAIQLGYKVILLADQHEFLQQFLWHIEGNEEEEIPKCTNLPELEEKYGKKLYGFPKTAEDYKNFQIFVLPYQQFIKDKTGRKRLLRIMKSVGTVMIDEVHAAAAECFSRVVNSFWTTYRFGVTATVNRKDGKQWIIKRVLGPVVAKTSVEALVPTVHIHNTHRPYRNPPKHWTYAMQRLAKDKKRNELIVEQVMKDIKAGHSVVIPVCFKKHVFDLVNMINEAYGRPIAEGFIGGGGEKNKQARRKILTLTKAGKVKVIVGIRRLLQRGLNVARWSAIYTIIPISNEPNYRQETKRVCTPMEGKKPIVRLFYEEALGQSCGCAKNCVTHLKGYKYKFSNDPGTKAALAYFASKARNSRGGYNEDDDFAAVKASFTEEDLSSSLGRARAGRR